MATNPWSESAILGIDINKTVAVVDFDPANIGSRGLASASNNLVKAATNFKTNDASPLPPTNYDFILTPEEVVGSKLDGVAKALPAKDTVKEAASAVGGLGGFSSATINSVANQTIDKLVDGSKNIITTGEKALGKAIGGLVGGLSGTIKGTFGAAGQAVPDVAASSIVKLAKPLFTAGSSDVGETVDIYGELLNSPQNKIKSVLDDVLGIVNKGVSGLLSAELAKVSKGSGLLNKITDPKTAEGILNKFKGSLLSGVPLSKDGMKNTLFEAIGYDGKSANYLDGIKGVGKSMLADIVSNVDGQTGFVTLYKDTQLILKGDFDTAEGMFKILENVTSNSKLGGLLDVTNQFKIINIVTKSLMNLGAPELFDDLIEHFTHDDKEKFFRDNIIHAIEVGDVDFINTALKHISPSWIRSHCPNVITILVGSYVPRTVLNGEVTKDEGIKFIELLNTLDENWHSGKVGYNLNVFANFNNSARLAILASGNAGLVAPLLVAENYGSSNINTLDQLQSRFPNYAIK